MALINYITQINLDFGALALLRAECERVGMRKPLIVTDAGVRAPALACSWSRTRLVAKAMFQPELAKPYRV